MIGGQFNNGFKDLARLGRSDTPSDGAPTSSAPSRISLLPSVRLPNILSHRDATEETAATDKEPILTLEVSSHSLIDCTVTDNVSTNPLYAVKTVGASTKVTRNSNTGGNMQFASIRWPKVLPTRIKGKEVSDGVEIQMGNHRYLGGGSLLKYGAKPNSTRKFQIPNYSQQLKWKRRGDGYWCTTTGLKGPIAALELAKDKKPIKLKVFETLRDKYDSRSVLYHQGVYILLLDYLIVTSILLLTDLQEWMLVRTNEEKTIAVHESLEGGVNSVEAMTSQWRKIMYREPIYPKLGGDSSSLLSTSDSHSSPSTPSSSHRPRDYRGSSSYHSSLQAGGESMLSFSDSEDEDELEDAVVATRPGSMSYPASISQPPSHSYFDPTFYPQDLPPVPPLPLQYAQSNLSLRDAAGTSSAVSSPISQTIRELPRPPSAHSHTASPLSEALSRISLQESTPPRPPFAVQSQSTPASTSNSPVVGRTRSMTTGGHRSRSSRPLPTVPAQATGSHLCHQPTRSNGSFQSMHTIRRARSHATLAEEDAHLSQEQMLVPPVPFNPYPTSPMATSLSGRSLRSLPPTPISMDPTSPRPEEIQEELKVAAATVHHLRQQQQHRENPQHHYTHHQPGHHAPTIRIPTSPLRKASITRAGTDDEDEDDGQGQWVQVLRDSSGRVLQPMPGLLYDTPPPAYSESQASYERDKAAAMENASPH